MQTALGIVGALVVVAVLAGFVLPLWRSTRRAGANSGYGAVAGESVDIGRHHPGHHGSDDGGHGGTDGGGG
jgi:hypothetical protein